MGDGVEAGWDRLIGDVTGPVGGRAWLRFLRSVVAGAAAGWAPDVERRTLTEFDAFAVDVERLRLIAGTQGFALDDFFAEMEALTSELELLRAAVALHRPDETSPWRCSGCGHLWPCETAQAANGEGDCG